MEKRQKGFSFMIGPIRRTLTLIVLSVRDMLASAGPVVLLAVGVLVAAYWWLDPQPPKTVTLATGPDGSAYAEFGQRYAQALAKNHIQVKLMTTEGSLATCRRCARAMPTWPSCAAAAPIRRPMAKPASPRSAPYSTNRFGCSIGLQPWSNKRQQLPNLQHPRQCP